MTLFEARSNTHTPTQVFPTKHMIAEKSNHIETENILINYWRIRKKLRAKEKKEAAAFENAGNTLTLT